jgi:hypothetical protein
MTISRDMNQAVLQLVQLQYRKNDKNLRARTM